MRRLATVLLASACIAGAGCGGKSGLSRDALETRYVDELIEAGVEDDVAECVIAEFFDELDDDALRVFNTAGTDLTEAQQRRIAELAGVCSSA